MRSWSYLLGQFVLDPGSGDIQGGRGTGSLFQCCASWCLEPQATSAALLVFKVNSLQIFKQGLYSNAIYKTRLISFLIMMAFWLMTGAGIWKIWILYATSQLCIHREVVCQLSASLFICT